MRYIYEAIFQTDGSGIFTEVPDLGGCFAGADNFEEALDKICSVLTMTIENALIEGTLPPATFGHTGERVVEICIEAFASGATKYTTRGAARVLEVNPSRIRQLVAEGVLAANKEGRDLLIPALEVERYKRERRPVGRPRVTAQAEIRHAEQG